MNIHEIFMSHRHNPVLHSEVIMDINQHGFYGNMLVIFFQNLIYVMVLLWLGMVSTKHLNVTDGSSKII